MNGDSKDSKQGEIHCLIVKIKKAKKIRKTKMRYVKKEMWWKENKKGWMKN